MREDDLDEGTNSGRDSSRAGNSDEDMDCVRDNIRAEERLGRNERKMRGMSPSIEMVKCSVEEDEVKLVESLERRPIGKDMRMAGRKQRQKQRKERPGNGSEGNHRHGKGVIQNSEGQEQIKEDGDSFVTRRGTRQGGFQSPRENVQDLSQLQDDGVIPFLRSAPKARTRT